MANIYDMADTWNNVATTFTAIKMNVTDTSSASGSLLMDLQVGGTSLFRVEKTGRVRVTADTSSKGLTFETSTNGTIWASNTQRLDMSWYNQDPVLSFYRAGGITTGNIQIADAGGTPSIRFYAGQDTTDAATGANSTWLRSAAGSTLELGRPGITTAQTFNIYNTYTDASNYERLKINFESNVPVIRAEPAGTGTRRNLKLATADAGGGNEVSVEVRTYDIYFYVRNTIRFTINNSGNLGVQTGVFTGSTTAFNFGAGTYGGIERSANPNQPQEGRYVIWMSDGTGLGDDGDVLIGSQAGGVINYAILFDHSAGTTWA